MKKLIGLALVLICASCSNNSPNSSGNSPANNLSQPTAPSAAVSPTIDTKREMRRTIVEQSKEVLEKSGGTASLEGANEELLKVSSPQLSDNEIMKLLNKDGDFNGFRNFGFEKIIIIDKNQKQREIDLTVSNQNK